MKTRTYATLTYFCRHALGAVAFVLLTGQAFAQKSTVKTDAGDIKVETLAENLNRPWGMAFLPDNRLLVTERSGTLRILDQNNKLSAPIKGTPEVFAKGQGGMLDVALDPDFKQNKLVYLSFADPGENGTASTAVGRGRLEGNELKDFKMLFQQKPQIEGPNHFGGRIAFTPEGHLILTTGERFQFDPAQDLSNHLGTVIRLNRDGSVPKDNPFVGKANARDEIWSYGHRNIESAAIDPATGKLWIVEMGPMGGDELNQPKAGKNYGWPVVSWGDNYDGSKIPRPNTRPEFADAAIHWTPTISPSGMVFYTANMFPEWKGTALIGGLTSTGLVRVKVNGEKAEEVERIPLVVRVRDVEQAPDGSIYVLTDQSNGKVLRLKPLK
ncbi:PQQ-dependent sugar dehydrogenase [Pontibacter akesuensis]|uniref:Glucose/arabinose dehydrogenase, beta-propeller fold n=1 Tax=Pontibacter akesuensis TaxID=388950 RepID=A0A1I7KGI3_9BACT|nr:PQQ-dependent sugar dehydrogenase [Pontibacter akesuensis]GHA79268.1 dehydrogenase [Pontibacter akesuensis]SFU96530.1 Glucose/arabinose dehydrogenase, beta-propeller fold [Pontibacter akesuensis]